MDGEFDRVVGEGKTDGYSQSRGPRRFSFAERFGKGPVKAGRDGAKEKFGLHGGAEERTQNGRFPVPALDQDGERVAQQAKEDGADRAVGALRARAVNGEGRQICTRSIRQRLSRKRPQAPASERAPWQAR